jgi:hypothetical protein
VRDGSFRVFYVAGPWLMCAVQTVEDGGLLRLGSVMHVGGCSWLAHIICSRQRPCRVQRAYPFRDNRAIPRLTHLQTAAMTVYNIIAAEWDDTVCGGGGERGRNCVRIRYSCVA